jgi:hypothetical protein
VFLFSARPYLIILYAIGLLLALLWLSQGGGYAAAIALLSLVASLIIQIMTSQKQQD